MKKNMLIPGCLKGYKNRTVLILFNSSFRDLKNSCTDARVPHPKTHLLALLQMLA